MALAVYVIPEPGTLMLVGISLVSILLFRVRSHR
ncbi:MAG: PEP-CTERM sorting domain-containing protein [Verrucomicrobia bacterium]|nr:PEP-CTERM sorting domain-containing protein [Verrucomicrobiota bacterium]MCH8514065.1 PEP-CTERM sorting domain-containing protein [Kiritimatiellia bacterium]